MDLGARHIRTLFVGISCLAGCDPSKADSAYWQRVNAPVKTDDGGAASDSSSSGGDGEPTSDASAPSTAAPDEGTESPAAQGTVQISATTVSYRGEYAPENVGAIWIADDSGALVRTLETWGSKRFKNAVGYLAVARRDEVDVVSSATRKSSGTHTVTWDRRDYLGHPTSGTSFLLNIEFTEDDSASDKPRGPHRVVPFSTADANAPATDDAYFTGIAITVVP